MNFFCFGESVMSIADLLLLRKGEDARCVRYVVSCYCLHVFKKGEMQRYLVFVCAQCTACCVRVLCSGRREGKSDLESTGGQWFVFPLYSSFECLLLRRVHILYLSLPRIVSRAFSSCNNRSLNSTVLYSWTVTPLCKTQYVIQTFATAVQ